MPEEVNIQDLQDQLRLYGDWLERRSDVALSNEHRSAVTELEHPDAIDPAPIAPALGEEDRFDPTDPPRGDWRLLTMAAMVVIAAGVSVLVFANRGEQAGTATVAGESEQSDVITTDEDQADDQLQREVLDVAPAGDEESSDARTDVNGEDDTGDAAADGGTGDDATDTEQETNADTGQEADAAESSNSTGNDSNDAGSNGADSNGADATGTDGDGTESTGSTEGSGEQDDDAAANADDEDAGTPTTVQEANDPPTSQAPDGDDDQGGGGFTSGTGIAFLSPNHGGTVDLNLGSYFQASEVEGATSYTFIGTQNDEEVLRVTVDSPTFLLPSRLNSLGQGWEFESGLMTITVIAQDDSGRQLASDTMQVVLRAGGAAPRLDVGPPGMPTASLDGDT